MREEPVGGPGEKKDEPAVGVEGVDELAVFGVEPEEASLRRNSTKSWEKDWRGKGRGGGGGSAISG